MEEEDYRALAARIAEEQGVDPSLFTRLIEQESRFDPTAVSGVGARGLGQIMPETARQPGYGVAPLPSELIEDPEANLRFSAQYLRAMLDEFDNDQALALAAYNAGAGTVREYGGVPPFEETQNYVATILGAAPATADVSTGSRTAPASAVDTKAVDAALLEALQSERLMNGDEEASLGGFDAVGAMGDFAALTQQPQRRAPAPQSLPLRLSPGRASATPGTQALKRMGVGSLLRDNPLLGMG